MDLMMMERAGDKWEKMEGSCSTGQSPQWAVVPVEEKEEFILGIWTICLLHVNRILGFFQIAHSFLSFYLHLKSKNSVFSKCCVMYFICSDSGNSSEIFQ
jgi:hypothetical protein